MEDVRNLGEKDMLQESFKSNKRAWKLLRYENCLCMVKGNTKGQLNYLSGITNRIF